MKTTTTSLRSRPARGTYWQITPAAVTNLLGTFLLLGCGAVSEAEMFSESTEALSEHLGESCESTPITHHGEVDVADGHPTCDPGYCVTRGGEPRASEGEGICSCRCDGPDGTGPFCSCTEGFSCQHVIDDIGLGNVHLAGSYCMPE